MVSVLINSLNQNRNQNETILIFINWCKVRPKKMWNMQTTVRLKL